MRKYFRVWLQLSKCAIGSYLSNRLDAVTYLIGKLVRFAFFFLFLWTIFNYTDRLASYGRYEALFFFLTFNLIDVFAQAFLRGSYMLKIDIRTGWFDHAIAKPVNTLFWSLARLTDILDILFLLPIIGLLVYVGMKLPIMITLANIVLYLLLLATGLVIVVALHIITIALTVLVFESENFIWLYRESMTIGRLPPEIYSVGIRFVFTYLMPIIIIIAYPVKALLGRLTAIGFLTALIFMLVFFFGALAFWRISLKHYSSASS